MLSARTPQVRRSGAMFLLANSNKEPIPLGLKSETGRQNRLREYSSSDWLNRLAAVGAPLREGAHAGGEVYTWDQTLSLASS